MEKFKTLRWERRITSFGATRYIGLPRVWLENVGLDRKDTVELELLSDGSLRLIPSSEEGVK